jgi:hypothetical protein
MGFNSYTSLVMFAACYAVAAKLCVAVEQPKPKPAQPEPAPYQPAQPVKTEVVAG